MQYKVEKVSSLERKMRIEIPSQDVMEAVEKKLMDIAKTANISGFRPGKVPAKVVKERYGQQAKGEVLADLMKHALFEAIEKEKDQPAAPPSIASIDQPDEGDVVFEASYEVTPEVSLADTTSLTFEKVEGSIDESDIDVTLDNIRKQHATWEVVEDVAEKDMRVTIDFVGTIDGELFDGGQGKDVAFIIGAKTMLEDFETGVVGMKVGDKKDVPVKFPENYHAKAYAGKQAMFAITLQKVERSQLPEIDEAFIKRFNVQDGSVESFRKDLKSNMEIEMENRIRLLLRNDVMQKMLDAHTIEIPKSMVHQEVDYRRRQQAHRADPKGQMSDEQLLQAFPDQLFEAQAKQHVAISLIWQAYIRNHQIQVDKNRVRAKVEEMAKSYEKPDEVVAWVYSHEKQLAEVEASVLEEQVIDHILDNGKMSAKKLSYTDIMKVA